MSGIEEQFIRESRFIPASATDQQLGTTRAGILQRLIIVPATTTPGAVSFRDGSAGTVRTVFVGGTVTVAPITVELGVRGADATGFHITTGANVSVIAVGKFTTV